MASPAASYTAKKSWPSTTTPGIPKPSARLAMSVRIDQLVEVASA